MLDLLDFLEDKYRVDQTRIYLTGLSMGIIYPTIESRDYCKCPGPFKSDPVDTVQRELFPSNVFDLLPTEHACYLFHDLFQQLDTSSIESQYSPWANTPIIRGSSLAF